MAKGKREQPAEQKKEPNRHVNVVVGTRGIRIRGFVDADLSPSHGDGFETYVAVYFVQIKTGPPVNVNVGDPVSIVLTVNPPSNSLNDFSFTLVSDDDPKRDVALFGNALTDFVAGRKTTFNFIVPAQDQEPMPQSTSGRSYLLQVSYPAASPNSVANSQTFAIN
jgi:hypothetical protein